MDVVKAKKVFVTAVGLIHEVFLLGLAALINQPLVQTVLLGIGVLIGIDTWRATKRV